jgi:hypothetical protein
MTRLRDTIKAFSLRQITRVQMPQLGALKNTCARFEVAASQIEHYTERLERIVRLLQSRRASLLERRDIRFATAAIGNSDLLGEAEVAEILAEIERRHSAPLWRAIFNALLASYRSEWLRLRLTAFLSRHFSALQLQVRQFCDHSHILNGEGYLQELASDLACSNNIAHFCLSKNITSSILGSNYGTELKIAALRKAVQSEDKDSIRNFLNWVFSTINGTPIGEYYEAMLAPFETALPPSEVQKLIIGKAVEKFRDPRIYSWPGLRGADGQVRRDRCMATIRRWLSIEYLDLFIRIIESTAVDRQFQPRKAFWLKYFERDKITDVTLILASDADRAARAARSRETRTEYMKWSKLNAALPNQSVLLMRLGDLIIAEWSHSGALRFWMATNEAAPEFHLPEYHGNQLRQGSLKIKVGNELKDAIIHHENRQWMRWSSNAISHYTGVSV